MPQIDESYPVDDQRIRQANRTVVNHETYTCED